MQVIVNKGLAFNTLSYELFIMIKPPITSLGPDFYDPVRAAHFPEAKLRYRNQDAAKSIGLNHLSPEQWQQHFHAFKPLPGNLSEALALRYHGHQFLNYNPELGDGRGFLFAQLKDHTGRWLDLGTKGSGTTPYSRSGDGRLTLKGAYREILATELLESLGVCVSKTLSVFETGESLVRNDEPSPTRSAVLVRLTHSHIRFGSFQRLAYLQQKENLQRLIQYTIENYQAELAELQPPATAATLLYKSVIQKSAHLVAQWMMAGFVHGVMNTDNMNINGEAFDFGPYRFLPRYDVRFTAAYFDHQGLYSFGRQPITMLWNLERLGECFEYAYPGMPYKELLEDFADEFNEATQNHFFKRLNIQRPQNPTAEELESVQKLIHYFFVFLEKSKANYEQCFFDLHSAQERWQTSPQKELYEKSDDFQMLWSLLKQFKIEDEELVQHTYFKNSKPCTLLIDEIENIWAPIASQDDWSLFEKKLEEIRSFRGVY